MDLSKCQHEFKHHVLMRYLLMEMDPIVPERKARIDLSHTMSYGFPIEEDEEVGSEGGSESEEVDLAECLDQELLVDGVD